MVPIDLLNAGLPQTLNLLKKKKKKKNPTISSKCNEARCAYINAQEIK